MKPLFFRLDTNGEPKRAATVFESAFSLANSKRRVAKSRVGKVLVSTVFLAIDHNHSGKGPPVLWETMVFGGRMDEYCQRCAGRREQAEAMHAKVLAAVRQAEREQTNRKVAERA